LEKERKGKKEMGPVVVTGASGFVGSWLVMKLLQAGYTVRATVRDPGALSVSHPLLFSHGQETQNRVPQIM
jgi:bifunctional dihydroflavonol 4-reductase/flavanone 4-reductase